MQTWVSLVALPGALILALCSGSTWGQPRFSSEGRFDFDSLERFDDVQFEPLEQRARARNPSVSDEEIAELVRRNFHYVFRNRLNEGRFLVIPPPRRVAEVMVEVLDLERRISDLIWEGRRLLASSHSEREALARTRGKAIVGEIDEAAKRLKKLFESNFVELQGSSYQFAAPSHANSYGVFLQFLLQAEKICRSLRSNLNNYFFNPAPGAVRVSDFKQVSVKVLTDALAKLCKMSRKSL